MLPHHDPCEQTHAFATVRVRYHVPVADGEEGDGDKPHGAQEVTGHFLFVMIPGGTQRFGCISQRGQKREEAPACWRTMVPCEPNRGGVRRVVGIEEGGEPRGQEAAFHLFCEASLETKKKHF